MSEPQATHQTIRLAAGKHRSPQDGVCVMELASMLAGEPFTDSPASVCPVVAAFMRTYNDTVDDGRRQDLYGFAARAVGTGDERPSRRRGRMCIELADSLTASRRRRLRLGWQPSIPAAIQAARALASDPAKHAAALTFLAGLIGRDTFDLELAGVSESSAPTSHRSS